MLLKVIYILCYSFLKIYIYVVCFCVCFFFFLNYVSTFKLTLIDPLHDKTNDLGFAPSKTEISLGIRPV